LDKAEAAVLLKITSKNMQLQRLVIGRRKTALPLLSAVKNGFG